MTSFMPNDLVKSTPISHGTKIPSSFSTFPHFGRNFRTFPTHFNWFSRGTFERGNKKTAKEVFYNLSFHFLSLLQFSIKTSFCTTLCHIIKDESYKIKVFLKKLNITKNF